MAYVHKRRNAAGVVTSVQVKWRLGGSRTAPQQTERFDDEVSALVFKKAVDWYGQQWPEGWVKGKGYINDGLAPDENQYRFRQYATRSIQNRTGIGEYYRSTCLRDLEKYVFPTFGECDVRSTEHFSGDTIRAWVRQLEMTMVNVGGSQRYRTGKKRPMSPKTIRNMHALLSSVLQEAVKTEPPLRERNPCKLTNLPRTDDDGADDTGEDIEFLTPEEMEGLTSCFPRRSDRLLLTVAYGTGMRWGEVTALAPMCILQADTASPQIRVRRAWKRAGEADYFMGPPKSRRGRRTIRISATVRNALVELGLNDLAHDQLIFCRDSSAKTRERLPYTTFRHRWTRAVKAAKEKGLIPPEKHPTFHDIRHSHAALLLSHGRGLTYVQHRLGHESIQTTSDTYGHLLPQADDEAMETIEQSLGVSEPSRVYSAEVFVAALNTETLLAFHTRELAEQMAEQWLLDDEDGGRLARVAPMTAAQWWMISGPGGLSLIREELPDRVLIYTLGPTAYAPDGAELASRDGTGGARAGWVWEWEKQYTRESSVPSVEWRTDGLPLTSAEAWGTDPLAVRETYDAARAEALRSCSLHPAMANQEADI
ncbi:tyrosine-type recombinase/integrase [Streptomyces niveus]|uniref:tyrosine-type recombinase/integrase n=1 Tax=Streptomyces niveus TaxID=193462 RepID=UPI0035DEEE43